ncbi:MAG: hypothetical protein FJW38_24765 [Acidobacteria bacterium]|nr:hypothetical protein [Acidobacteriota bacterium]
MQRLFAGVVLAAVTVWPQTGGVSYQVQTLAGTNTVGDGGPAAAALLRQVEGIATKPDGTIYLADAADHRIRVISPEGTISTLAGNGSPGSDVDGGPAGKARLNSPYGLALDRLGNLYVADLGNARVRLITTDGKIRTVAGGGEIGLGSAEGTPATSVKFLAPRNVLADDSGGFYFSDFDAHRVFYVNTSGVLSTFAGTGAAGYGADNIAASRSALRNPAGLIFEPLGGVVIVESGSHRLRRVLRGMIGPYLADFVRLNPLYSPTSIAIDSTGATFIADARASGVLKRTAQGEAVALPIAGRTVATHPPGGAIYALNASVQRVDTANKLSTIAAASQIGEVNGDGGSAENARFSAPSGLAVDREGNIFIADERSHRVRKILPNGVIVTVAGTGAAGYSGDGFNATRAGLTAPRGLTLDRFGNLYIADSGNHAIRRVSPSGTIATIVGNGFKGGRGDGGPASAAQLDTPSGVAVGTLDDIFIADSGNHRIRRISTSGFIATYAGTGVSGFAFDGSAAVFSHLSDPRDVAADSAGNLFIADTGNNRIRRVDATGVITTLGDAEFSFPRGVAVGANGTVYVADTGKHRICQINGSVVTKIAGGEAGFDGDGLSGEEARFQFPSAIAVDRDEKILIADTGNYRLRRQTKITLAVGILRGSVRTRSAATGKDAPIVAGMIAELEGENLAPAGTIVLAPVNGRFPLVHNGVEVRINGEPAELVALSPTKLRVRMPQGIDSSRDAGLEVLQNGVVRASSAVPTAISAPALFPVVIREDGTPANPTNPAPRGTVVLLFGTGEGALDPASASFTVGGMEAQVVWGGPLPSAPGIFQINLRLPTGFFGTGLYTITGQLGAFRIDTSIDVPIQ